MNEKQWDNYIEICAKSASTSQTDDALARRIRAFIDAHTMPDGEVSDKSDRTDY